MTDWVFDFSQLPRWDIREESPWVSDAFYEVGDYLICLYSINEVSMLNYQGFLAVLRNKAAPELVANPARSFPFWQTFHASGDGRFVFLQACIPGKRPVVILDLEQNRFAWAFSRNMFPFLKVIENSDRVFTTVFQNRKRRIRTRWLRWYPMERLEQLRRMA